MEDTDLDSCLRLVADRRRRELLQHLRHSGEREVGMGDLVDRLYEAESGAGDGAVGRHELAIQLSHTHLPKLAEHGVIEPDYEQGSITYRPDERVETVLDRIPEEPSVANC